MSKKTSDLRSIDSVVCICCIFSFLEDGTQIFHAGTRIQENTLVTSGGRVFGVTAQATDIEQARNRVYQLMENIKFRGMQFRSDIGAKAL